MRHPSAHLPIAIVISSVSGRGRLFPAGRNVALVSMLLISMFVQGARAVTPATPSDNALVETLIPASALPSGGGIGSGIGYYVILPGVSSTWDPACCTNGPTLIFVISGTFSVRSAADVEIVRVDGSLTSVPAETDVLLTSGDSLITQYQTVSSSANTSPDPVHLLEWNMIGGGSPFEDSHDGWGFKSGDGWGPMNVPDESAKIELRTITVEGGEVIEPAESGLRFIVSTVTNVFASMNDDGSHRIAGDPGTEYTVYVLTFRSTSGDVTPATPVPIGS